MLYQYIEHIQYISTLIQAKPELYRSLFGVQFMLDVIRVYYSSMGNTRIATQPEVTSLSEEDLQLMRSALYSITKLYIMKDVSKDEVEAILNFLASCQDLVVVSVVLSKLCLNCFFLVGRTVEVLVQCFN